VIPEPVEGLTPNGLYQNRNNPIQINFILLLIPAVSLVVITVLVLYSTIGLATVTGTRHMYGPVIRLPFVSADSL
jgi:hypothetical protein